MEHHNLKEIAQGLELPLSTLERWIRQGRIPIQKKGENGIFKKAVLKDWAARHHLNFFQKPVGKHPESVTDLGSLALAMRKGDVFYDIPGDTVETVLDAAAGIVPGLSADARRSLYSLLLERERLTSTGIGKGVAIPHPRAPIVEETGPAAITTCFLSQPVAYGAIDDKPVFVLFILMSPSVKTHLHLLSRLAFCVREDTFVDFLRAVPQPDDLYSKIADFESKLED